MAMRTFRLLHLNIWHGKLLPEIIKYITVNDFDILCFQEVSGGEYPPGRGDLFVELQQALRDYHGELVKTSNKPGDKKTYMGNAMFIRNDLRSLNRDVIWMQSYKEQEIFFNSVPSNSELGWALLALTLGMDEGNGRKFTVATGHFRWGLEAVDTEAKIACAKKAYDYLKQLKQPFIMTADLNVTPDTITASQFNKIARNLVVEAGLTNTVNQRYSKHKHLFPPGLVCDYIFTSPGITVLDFKLVGKPDLSDHYGLFLEFEV